MEKREPLIPSRLRGRGVDVSKTLFYLTGVLRKEAHFARVSVILEKMAVAVRLWFPAVFLP